MEITKATNLSASFLSYKEFKLKLYLSFGTNNIIRQAKEQEPNQYCARGISNTFHTKEIRTVFCYIQVLNYRPALSNVAFSKYFGLQPLEFPVR